MEKLEKLMSISPSFEDDSIHLVEVTYAVDPSNFYIRPVKYKPIIEALESMIPNSKSTCYNIQDMVIFDAGDSELKHIRARITAISRVENQIQYDLFAIDYGFNKKLIPRLVIWDCPQRLINTPPMAYNCQLANCTPADSKGFTPETILAFKHYTGLEPVKMSVLGKKPNKILVELKNSAKHSIASILAIKGYPVIQETKDTQSWNPFSGYKRNYFDFKKLAINEKLHVRVLSGNSLNEFYVARVSDYKKHLKEIDIITTHARREFALSPVHLVVGTLVCVNIENTNKYERAFISKVTKPYESAIVTLVDWGRREEFHVKKMKYMPLRCLKTPVLSIYCKCVEQQAWHYGLERFICPGIEFYIMFKRIGHEFETPNKVYISALVADDGRQEASLSRRHF